MSQCPVVFDLLGSLLVHVIRLLHSPDVEAGLSVTNVPNVYITKSFFVVGMYSDICGPPTCIL